MKKELTIDDVMTKKVITTFRDTPLMQAVDLLIKNNFNGLPVIDEQENIVGMLTEYDLMIKGSSIHLPTLLRLISEFDVYRNDKKFVRSNIQKLITMKVGDVMNTDPVILSSTASIEKAVNIFCRYKDVNPIAIVNSDNKLAGIISRYDLVKLFSSSVLTASQSGSERQLDKKINTFLATFKHNFIFVSKKRTSFWIIFYILSALIGFIISFLIIVRIRLQ